MYYRHLSWEACILITSSNTDNRRFGTGFIIYHFGQKSYVVTCAHVISDVGIDSIEVDGQLASIVCIGADDGLDLAIVETNELLGKPIFRLGLHGGAGNPFYTAGFRTFGRHFSIAPLSGNIVTAVALESRTYHERVKAWNLEIENGEYLHDGYSGSPVIDTITGFCLGVITYKQGEGSTGLAIAIEELEKIWLAMPVGIIEKRFENQSYCDRLASQATQLNLIGDLSQALDIYKEIRSLEPSYPRINIIINSVEEEMKKPYINRYGLVNESQVFDSTRIPTTGATRPSNQERPQPPNSVRLRLALRRTIVFTVAIIIIVIIFILILKLLFSWLR
jgi:hypothetical protein